MRTTSPKPIAAGENYFPDGHADAAKYYLSADATWSGTARFGEKLAHLREAETEQAKGAGGD